MFAPAGTPAAVLARLNQVLNSAMKQPDTLKKLAGVGAEPIGSTPQELATHLSQELDRWGRLIKERNIRLD
ncbi:Tripartite tricarboxylate transporter family receptor [compost metagenome]